VKSELFVHRDYSQITKKKVKKDLKTGCMDEIQDYFLSPAIR